MSHTPHRSERVFLDCAASTPVDPAVAERILTVQRALYANAASVHRAGILAAREVERARCILADRLGCDPSEITFTSGGTESNNLAIKGLIDASPHPVPHLVISSVEHPSVLDVAAWLEASGRAAVTRLPVDGEGRVDPGDVARALRPETALVSVMHANNEVGTVQPIAAIRAACREAGVPLHADACQSFAKLPLSADQADLLTLNAHKIHGPKGVGALYVRRGLQLTPLLHGGGQEGGLRSGTLNVPGIAGFGEAVARYTAAESERVRGLRDRALARLREALPGLATNSPERGVLGNIINIALPGRSGKDLARDLDRMGFQVSPSSACHATQLTPSHVLLAMGQAPERADRALRISLGRTTTAAELDGLVDALRAIVTGASP